jgi:hypothetical protein
MTGLFLLRLSDRSQPRLQKPSLGSAVQKPINPQIGNLCAFSIPGRCSAPVFAGLWAAILLIFGPAALGLGCPRYGN